VASDLNWTAGETVANLTVATLSGDGSISVYNHSATADVIVDAFGYFAPATTPQASPTDQTITYTDMPPSYFDVGSTEGVSATASSLLTVTFTIDSSSTAICSLSGGDQVLFNAAGTCTIDANQAGNSTYAPAPQVQQSITVDLDPVLNVSTQNPAGGATVDFTLTNAGPDTTYNIVEEPTGYYAPCTATGEPTCTADGLSDDFGSLSGTFQAQVVTGPGGDSNSVTVAWGEPTLTASTTTPAGGATVSFTLTNGNPETTYTLTETITQEVMGSCTPDPSSTTCTVAGVGDSFGTYAGIFEFTGTDGSASNTQVVTWGIAPTLQASNLAPPSNGLVEFTVSGGTNGVSYELYLSSTGTGSWTNPGVSCTAGGAGTCNMPGGAESSSNTVYFELQGSDGSVSNVVEVVWS
jgi:hypothetical protein